MCCIINFVRMCPFSWEVQAGFAKGTLFGKRKVREHVIPLVSIGNGERGERTRHPSASVTTEGHAEMTTSVWKFAETFDGSHRKR